MKRWFCLGLLVLTFLGCKGNPMAPDAPAKVKVYPVVETFEFQPNECWYLEDILTTLRWKVTNATNVSIDHNIGKVDLEGSLQLKPSTTLTYTLYASNNDGSVSVMATYFIKDRAVWQMTSYAGYDEPGGWHGYRGTIMNIGNKVAFSAVLTWTAYDKNNGPLGDAMSPLGTVGKQEKVNFDCKVRTASYPDHWAWKVVND